VTDQPPVNEASPASEHPDAVHRLVAELAAKNLTVAVAESLTGGLIMAGLTSVPGVSRVFRGGVVAYATDTKESMLGVDAELLETSGAVDPDVAEQMAVGVRERFDVSFGLSSTGVAGPDDLDGNSPGLVFVAVSAPFGVWHRELLLEGDRSAVRTRAGIAALELLSDVLARV
jgi:nicotinamide-nucleotide amidase